MLAAQTINSNDLEDMIIYYKNPRGNWVNALTAENIIPPLNFEVTQINGNVMKYLVTFDTNGGSSVSNQTIIEGNKITQPTNPTKSGYSFAGWKLNNNDYDFNTNVTSNITLVARWNPIIYQVQYMGNGNVTGSMQNTTCAYDMECVLSENTYNNSGYVFMGWSLHASGEVTYQNNVGVNNLSSIQGGIIQLYAVWAESGNTISYSLGGGNVTDNPNTYTVTTDTFTLNAPTKTGYIFTGWTGSNGEIPQISVSIMKGTTGDLSYTAHWVAKQYTITINHALSDSYTGPDIIEATYGETVDLPSNLSINRHGYEFLNWVYKLGSSNRAILFEFDSTHYFLEQDIEIYPEWNFITYDIQYYDLQGAINNNPLTYTIEDTPLTLNNLTRTGYHFNGWIPQNSLTATRNY